MIPTHHHRFCALIDSKLPCHRHPIKNDEAPCSSYERSVECKVAGCDVIPASIRLLSRGSFSIPESLRTRSVVFDWGLRISEVSLLVSFMSKSGAGRAAPQTPAGGGRCKGCQASPRRMRKLRLWADPALITERFNIIAATRNLLLPLFVA